MDRIGVMSDMHERRNLDMSHLNFILSLSLEVLSIHSKQPTSDQSPH